MIAAGIATANVRSCPAVCAKTSRTWRRSSNFWGWRRRGWPEILSAHLLRCGWPVRALKLFRGLIAHEPPLFSLLADDPSLALVLGNVNRTLHAVAERIASGDHAGAAEQFVETVLGPGTWPQLAPDVRKAVIENAPTFLDEANDPEQFAFDLEAIKDFWKPTLLTRGEASPPIFTPVVSRLAEVLPHAEVLTLPGAGHIPHATHPLVYVDAILAFTCKHQG
jgi:pimeloyl-ACP methyl ester carboxylesterase